jgi:hypothetical protein
MRWIWAPWWPSSRSPRSPYDPFDNIIEVRLSTEHALHRVLISDPVAIRVDGVDDTIEWVSIEGRGERLVMARYRPSLEFTITLLPPSGFAVDRPHLLHR